MTGRNFVTAAAIIGSLGLAGCSGGEEDGAVDEPLIDAAPSVVPSGGGPGNQPVPPDSIPLGVTSRGAPASGAGLGTDTGGVAQPPAPPQ